MKRNINWDTNTSNVLHWQFSVAMETTDKISFILRVTKQRRYLQSGELFKLIHLPAKTIIWYFNQFYEKGSDPFEQNFSVNRVI